MSALVIAQYAALLLAIAGAVVASRGSRRAARGAALARGAASIQSQMTRPPREVIEEAQRGLALARSGRRLALRGLILSAVGCAVVVALAVWQAFT